FRDKSTPTFHITKCAQTITWGHKTTVHCWPKSTRRSAAPGKMAVCANSACTQLLTALCGKEIALIKWIIVALY
ncbi:hypothetical protein FXN95_29170, partial [Klebsiella pneumoniae]